MPPHTPVSYLKAGGSAFFSLRCQKLMIGQGLDPDSFGSYDAVAKRIRDAKLKIARWNAMTQPQRDANQGARPTAQDRFNASCTASHLIRDGNYRDARIPGGTPPLPAPGAVPMNTPGAHGRGNPCASRVDGYTEGTAPAFPGEGNGNVPGSMEQRLSAQENAQNAAVGPSGTTYPAQALDRDEDRRTQTIVQNQRDRWNAQNPPGTPANLAGTGRGGRASGPAENQQFADAIGAKPKAPTCTKGEVIDGNSAADCINKWRKAAKKEMMKQGLKDEIDRTTNEATPAAQAAAATNAANARANTAAAQAAANAPGLPADEQARRNAALSAARLEEASAREAHQRTQSAASRLPCLQAMQAGVQSGNPRVDGRTV